MLSYSTTEDIVKVSISDACGKVVFSENGKAAAQAGLGIIETSKLKPGIYFISFITHQGQSFSRKIIRVD